MLVELKLGDCLEEMNGIPDGNIDLILCDLPYGLSRAEWDRKIDLDKLWTEYKRIIKENGAIVLFSQQPFTTELINSNRKMFRYEIVWEKTLPTGFLNAKRMPLKAHENICIFYRKLPTYNPQKWTKSRGRRIIRRRLPDSTELYGRFKGTATIDDGSRYPTDVVHFSNQHCNAFCKPDGMHAHSAQKPVPLLEWLIKTYSNDGDLVLDNCMGSG